MLRTQKTCCGREHSKGSSHPGFAAQLGKVFDMFRTTLALAAAATVCGLAHAEEPRMVTAKLTYEPAKLTTEQGATEVLVSLQRQARRACRTLSMVSVGFSYDQQCADTMVADAVTAIGHENLAESYAELAAVETAESDF